MFGIGVVLSHIVARQVAAEADAGMSKEFNYYTERIEADISLLLRRYELVLHGSRGLFLASEGVTNERFKAYQESLGAERLLPGVISIGFAPRVAADEIAAFEDRMRKDGSPDFKVRPPVEDFDAYPIAYRASWSPSLRGVAGFNLASEPRRRFALDRTMANGMVSMSQRIDLLNGDSTKGRSGALMLMRVPYPADQHRAGALGVVYLAVDIGQLMQHAIGVDADSPVQVKLYDGDGMSGEGELLYASEGSRAASKAESAFHRKSLLHVGGTPWLLDFSATADHPTWAARRESHFALATGSLISLIVAAVGHLLARGLHRASLRAERLAKDRALDQAQLTGLVDSAMDAIISLDGNLRIVLFNAAAEKMFGYMAREMVGRTLDVLLPERVRGAHAAHIQRFLTTGRSIRAMGNVGKIFGVRANGNEFPIEASISCTSVGSSMLLTVIMRDISGRLKAEEDLRRHRDHLQELVDGRTAELVSARDAAEASNRAKSQFLANMSHELRTPMHAIMSFSELGSQRVGTALPDKLRNYFCSINTSGRRLTSLIDDLLDLSKLEAGKVELALGVHDLAGIVDEVVNEFAPLLREKSLNLFRESAEQCWFTGDAQRIGQVVRNLLSNAIKFSPSGGRIEISIDGAPSDCVQDCAGLQPGVRMRIADNGIGIPAAELESVFDKFVQSSKTRSGAGGTGLGLAICKEIVDLHGGCISATSRAGGGALFEMVLPVQPPPSGSAERKAVECLEEVRA